ncbi:MAG: Plug domain-containing protein [Nitrospinae bacterium]|nr:Plug domain-containing protein [Nitrospinota bacterium]
MREAPAIATVITAEQIRNMGARNLLDVLKTVPGIGVYQEFVGLKTVEVRGIKTQNAEKVLIMIDGHRSAARLFPDKEGIVFNEVNRYERKHINYKIF